VSFAFSEMHHGGASRFGCQCCFVLRAAPSMLAADQHHEPEPDLAERPKQCRQHAFSQVAFCMFEGLEQGLEGGLALGTELDTAAFPCS
jgi:hypothetical protein